MKERYLAILYRILSLSGIGLREKVLLADRDGGMRADIERCKRALGIGPRPGSSRYYSIGPT